MNNQISQQNTGGELGKTIAYGKYRLLSFFFLIGRVSLYSVHAVVHIILPRTELSNQDKIQKVIMK